jgi:hypothetical protein
MAQSLATDVARASRLGKIALTFAGRRLAYEVKAKKLSTGLLKFRESFKVVSAARDLQFGILLLIRLPNGGGAHIPMNSLTAEAQKSVHSSVVKLIEGESQRAAA